MDTCDVLIVGGGPAGSSCAWKLRQAGLDVVIMDRAVFPRDKVCAGWITPQVIADLDIDLSDYARGRTLQPITGFRTGTIGGRRGLETAYERPISYGIRRCEFDDYLVKRSGARLALGAGVTSIRREGAGWVVNESVSAAMLVGAGGHFCPVARWLNPPVERSPLVVAQEAEFRLDPEETSFWKVAPQTPELYFCRDLAGYGWCFRKGEYVNIGLGRLDRHALPMATEEFVAFLRGRGLVPPGASWRWRGHAYLTAAPPRRRVSERDVLLVGDAAGLAYSESGEGIRPAVESGLLAASALVGTAGGGPGGRVESYEQRLRERFGLGPARGTFSSAAPGVGPALLPWLLGSRWFVRNVVLNRWFLHTSQPVLSPL